MTTPRADIVDPDSPGFYHCVSRCVRRACLCGVDSCTDRSFEHRKAWVEARLLELAEVFAVGVYAYAVMRNHLHVVTCVDPGVAWAWSPEEVATRWMRLLPVRERSQVDEEATRLRAMALSGNPARSAVCRARLASLSWFMRCLSEPIARRANREDTCTGRFREGRYRCQGLLDDAAVVRCARAWRRISRRASTRRSSNASSDSNPSPWRHPSCRSRESPRRRCRSICASTCPWWT